MPVEDLIKEIAALKLTAVQARLKKEKVVGSKFTDTKTKASYTPLHAAVKAASLPIVEELIKNKADVNAADNDGATPLHWAAMHNDKPEIIDALVKAKADVKAVTKAGKSAVYLAAERGAAVLITALAAGQAPLDMPAPPSSSTPLHVAAAGSHMAAVGALVAAGAKLSVQDGAGFTPLMRALEGGKYGEARALLGLGGCGLDAQEPAGGLTALSLAVQKPAAGGAPDLGMVDVLLTAGASPDTQDAASKATPIITAIKGGHTQVALRLIKASKNLNLASSSGETALGLALGGAGGGSELVPALLSAGADAGKEGPSALKKAMAAGDDATATELVGCLAREVLASAGVPASTPLVAAKLPRAAVAYMTRFEVDAGGKLLADSEGNTKLHQLAEAGASYELVLAVAQGAKGLGIDINALNKAGETALHVAALKGHVDACRGLVEGGADPLRRNGKNRRPREQPKCPDATREYLGQAEEDAKEAKASKQSELWDDKMRATQTESAFGLRVV